MTNLRSLAGRARNATAPAAPIALPRLPYAEDALAPVISARTLEFHYGKHHKTYVDTLNKLIAGTELADQPLEAIVRASAGKADKTKIFNNAAQAWNHAFYWRCLKPGGGGDPTGSFAIRSPARSAASSSSGRTSPRQPSSNSAAAGPGSSPTAAS